MSEELPEPHEGRIPEDKGVLPPVRARVMEGDFDDFSLMDVLEVLSIARQRMVLELWCRADLRGTMHR